jgi:hypothetical protein
MVVLAVLPIHKQMSNERLTELVGKYGNPEIISWLYSKSIGLVEIYIEVSKHARFETFQWMASNLLKPWIGTLKKCAKAAINFHQFDFCVWLCENYFGLDLHMVIQYAEKRREYSFANEIRFISKKKREGYYRQ